MNTVEWTRYNRMLFRIHIYLRIYVGIYAFTCMRTHPEIEQSFPRCCTRFFKRSSFYSECYCIYVYRLFSPSMCGRFSSSWRVDREQREKGEKGKGKTYFGMKNSGGVSSPVARVSRSDFLRIANDNEECPVSD